MNPVASNFVYTTRSQSTIIRRGRNERLDDGETRCCYIENCLGFFRNDDLTMFLNKVAVKIANNPGKAYPLNQ
jgi:hypothetical protein